MVEAIEQIIEGKKLSEIFLRNAPILTKDIRMVQQSLGHTTLKMTKRYAHFVEKDQVKTSNLVTNKFYALLNLL